MVNIGGGVQIVASDYRKSSRAIVDSFPVTDIIWERLKPFIPDDLFPKTQFLPGWDPYCLNERLRFLRYDPGDFFKMHCDGTFSKSATATSEPQSSKVTLQLYLNEGFEGGATTFMAHEGDANIPCVPKTGMALVFQ